MLHKCVYGIGTTLWHMRAVSLVSTPKASGIWMTSQSYDSSIAEGIIATLARAERCTVLAQDYVAALADMLPSNPSIQLAPAAAESVVRLAREAVRRAPTSADGQRCPCLVWSQRGTVRLSLYLAVARLRKR